MRRKITVGRGAGNRPHDQQSEQAQAAHPKAHEDRRNRRAQAAWKVKQTERAARAKRRRRASDGPSGDSAVSTWHKEYVSGLQTMAGRFNIFERLRGVDDILLADANTVRGRKRICIRLAREQAAAVGVDNATWACCTRKQRGRLADAGKAVVVRFGVPAVLRATEMQLLTMQELAKELEA